MVIKFFINKIFLFICLVAFQNCFYAQEYFKQCNVEGSTTIYDYKEKKWIFTDSVDAYRETLPASTFKIINSLIALETKTVKDENEILFWDQKDKKFFGKSMAVWNKDTDLKNAYKNSTIWFYVEIAKRVGRKKYKKYLKETNYGNSNLDTKGVDFWNYGEFGVSPVNQIEFLIKLYENKLPFSLKNIEKVKNIMISEGNSAITYHDKTGWTRKNGKDIGWHVGYAETPDNTYFFATRLTENVYPENRDFSKCRSKITKDILNNYRNKDSN